MIPMILKIYDFKYYRIKLFNICFRTVRYRKTLRFSSINKLEKYVKEKYGITLMGLNWAYESVYDIYDCGDAFKGILLKCRHLHKSKKFVKNKSVWRII